MDYNNPKISEAGHSLFALESSKSNYVLKMFLLFVLFVLVSIDAGGASGGKGVDGISAVFLKKRELMEGDSWHSRPLSVEEAVKNISKYDAVWGAQIIARYNRPTWRCLRQNRPSQIMLYSLSASTIRKDDVMPRPDPDYVNKHNPEWFLLKDARNAKREDYKDENKRIRWSPDDPSHTYYNRFYLDVANKDFQQWAAKEVLAHVTGERQGLAFSYSGVAFDNVYVGKRLHQRFQHQYPHWKYANDFEAWHKGFADYLKIEKKLLNEHGFILVVNHNPVGRDRGAHEEVWRVFYESVDGILTEQALRQGWKDSSYFANAEWLAAIRRHEEVLEHGLINWWACHISMDSKRAHDIFLYTYCSWLLVKKPGKSFYSIGTPSSKKTVPWYDEYDLPIGEPTSGRYLQNNCWLRNYESAKVVVNPTREIQRVIIDKERRWLDWESKRAVNEFNVPPQSGRILLPISYQK